MCEKDLASVEPLLESPVQGLNRLSGIGGERAIFKINSVILRTNKLEKASSLSALGR